MTELIDMLSFVSLARSANRKIEDLKDHRDEMIEISNMEVAQAERELVKAQKLLEDATKTYEECQALMDIVREKACKQSRVEETRFRERLDSIALGTSRMGVFGNLLCNVLNGHVTALPNTKDWECIVDTFCTGALTGALKDDMEKYASFDDEIEPIEKHLKKLNIQKKEVILCRGAMGGKHYAKDPEDRWFTATLKEEHFGYFMPELIDWESEWKRCKCGTGFKMTQYLPSGEVEAAVFMSVVVMWSGHNRPTPFGHDQ